MFLSLTFSLPSPLSKLNKIFKKKFVECCTTTSTPNTVFLYYGTVIYLCLFILCAPFPGVLQYQVEAGNRQSKLLSISQLQKFI